ncbi:hypothetical protein [Streptomyces altiplanensis]
MIARRSGFVRSGYVADCRGVLGDELTVTEVDADHMLYLERPDLVGPLLRSSSPGVTHHLFWRK